MRWNHLVLDNLIQLTNFDWLIDWLIDWMNDRRLDAHDCRLILSFVHYLLEEMMRGRERKQKSLGAANNIRKSKSQFNISVVYSLTGVSRTLTLGGSHVFSSLASQGTGTLLLLLLLSQGLIIYLLKSLEENKLWKFIV